MPNHELRRHTADYDDEDFAYQRPAMVGYAESLKYELKPADKRRLKKKERIGFVVFNDE